MGLLGTLKLIFVFLVTVQANMGENFTGKTGKNFTVNFLDKKLYATENEKRKKTSNFLASLLKIEWEQAISNF